MMMIKPNILLFFPDALRPEPLRPDHPCLTPNFEKVAARGVTFSRAYTSSPTCSPARASLMTGLLPHNHGVLQVEHCVDDDQSVLRLDKPHWAQRLVNAGYVTGYFGKWHIERSEVLEDFGWQTHRSWRTDAYRKAKADLPDPEQLLDMNLSNYFQHADGYQKWLYYGVADLPVDQLPVTLPVDFAEHWLDDVLAAGGPWCCGVSFPDPNEQLIASAETIEKYDFDEIELPVSLRDEMNGAPAFYRRLRQMYDACSEEEWKKILMCYYARVTEVDQQLGRLLDKLENAGQLDNTIVIISTDHGRYLGAHGMDAHNFGAYEEIYRIPLIISGPGIARGVETDALVALHDLCPTILDLANAPQIDVPDSKSFASVLKDPGNIDGFKTVFAENHGTRYPLAQRVLWDGDWKFVFNGFDFDELYNLAEDPHELQNLINDPAQQERVKTMMKQMWQVMRDTDDKPLVESHYYAMQFAPVGPEA